MIYNGWFMSSYASHFGDNLNTSYELGKTVIPPVGFLFVGMTADSLNPYIGDALALPNSQGVALLQGSTTGKMYEGWGLPSCDPHLTDTPENILAYIKYYWENLSKLVEVDPQFYNGVVLVENFKVERIVSTFYNVERYNGETWDASHQFKIAVERLK